MLCIEAIRIIWISQNIHESNASGACKVGIISHNKAKNISCNSAMNCLGKLDLKLIYPQFPFLHFMGNDYLVATHILVAYYAVYGSVTY